MLLHCVVNLKMLVSDIIKGILTLKLFDKKIVKIFLTYHCRYFSPPQILFGRLSDTAVSAGTDFRNSLEQ